MKQHIFIAARCIFCNVNDLDSEMYYIPCVERDEIYIYSTSTGGELQEDKQSYKEKN